MAALLRCTVCGEGLSEDDFHSSLCRFHVGNYASGAWRCCNASGEAAPGCAAGCHVRNVDTQQAQQHASDGEHSDGDASGARLERDEGDAAEPPEPFVNVILGSSDTLAGIALRYNTTPEAIMTANSMLSPLSFSSRSVIRVPTADPPPPGPAPDRRLLVQRLASAATARRGHPATAEEASAYLDLAGGDIGKALRALSEDAEWETRCVANAFEARRASGDGGARAAAAGAAVAAAAAAVAGGLRAVRSSIASAVAAGGGGTDNDVEDDKLD